METNLPHLSVWVFILGVSIYSGPCCFVLTKDATKRFPTCWSVVDGQDASTLDTWNPIRSIYLLANEDNVGHGARTPSETTVG